MDRLLHIEQKIFINCSRERTWDALTNPRKIEKYLFGTKTTSNWQVGSEILFEGEYNGQTYRDKGIIKEFEPPIRLQYTYWSSFSGTEDHPDNYALVTFLLNDFAEGTELTLKQQGFDDKEARDHSLSLWKTVLKQLKDLLEREI